jgi:hypothetical protein
MRARKFAEQVAGREAMTEPLLVETNGLTWMAVHGAICLGCRHPHYVGPSRILVVAFVRELGQRLVEAGVLTKDEVQMIERLEQEESPHGGL